MRVIPLALAMMAASSAPPAGGGPVLLSVNTRLFTTMVTTHNVLMPTTVDVGDLLVVIFTTGFFYATKPTGWSMFQPDAAYARGQVFYKVAVGTEDATNVNFSTSTEGAQNAIAFVLRYQAGTFNAAYPIEQGAILFNESTVSPAATLSPSWGAEDTHWIALAETQTFNVPDVDVSGYPYAANQTNGKSYSDNKLRMVMATANMNGASQTPAQWTWNFPAQVGVRVVGVRPVSALVEHTGITWTQSSVFGSLTASATNMRDINTSQAFNANVSGAATAASGTPWIKANLGSAKSVSEIILGGGNLSGFGASGAYAEGGKIQSSTDNVNWTDRATITGVPDEYNRDKLFKLAAPITAQYWRIRGTDENYIGIGTFRLFG